MLLLQTGKGVPREFKQFSKVTQQASGRVGIKSPSVAPPWVVTKPLKNLSQVLWPPLWPPVCRKTWDNSKGGKQSKPVTCEASLRGPLLAHCAGQSRTEVCWSWNLHWCLSKSTWGQGTRTCKLAVPPTSWSRQALIYILHWAWDVGLLSSCRVEGFRAITQKQALSLRMLSPMPC